MASGTDTVPGSRARPAGRWGWLVVARKEFADNVHSVRLLILAVLIGLAGLASLLAAAGEIRDAATEATGTPALFLRLFTLTAEDSRLPSFFQFVGFLGPLLGIAFGFDAINGERAQGTLPRLLSQPIYRDDVVNGKFVAGLATIGLVLTSLAVFVASVGMLRIGVVPSLSDGLRLFAFLVVSLVYVAFWLGLSTLFSVALRRAATSALAALASWLVLILFFGLLTGLLADTLAPVPDQPTPDEALRNARVELTLSRVSPSTLYEEATIVLLNPQQRFTGIVFLQQLDRAVPNPLSFEQSLLLVWPQVVGLVALTVIVFAAAYVLFMRQEVRA